MPPKKTPKEVKKTNKKTPKEEKPIKKNQKGGISSTDEPDSESSDDYLSEHSEEDNVDESTEQTEENYDEMDDEDSLGDGEKVDEEQDDDHEMSESESEKNSEKNSVKDDNEDECLYRFASKKDDDVEGEDYFDDDSTYDEDKYVSPEKRQTKPILFDNERVRILGDRARQLSLGAKPMLSNVLGMDPKEMAKMELAEKTMPLFIIRTLPNGKIEKWRINELQQL